MLLAPFWETSAAVDMTFCRSPRGWSILLKNTLWNNAGSARTPNLAFVLRGVLSTSSMDHSSDKMKSRHLVVLSVVKHPVGHVDCEGVGDVGRLVVGVSEKHTDVLFGFLDVPELVVPETDRRQANTFRVISTQARTPLACIDWIEKECHSFGQPVTNAFSDYAVSAEPGKGTTSRDRDKPAHAH